MTLCEGQIRRLNYQHMYIKTICRFYMLTSKIILKVGDFSKDLIIQIPSHF